MSAAVYSLPQRLLAELFGTAGLLMVVVGSGVMGEQLAAGNTAMALMANAVATGAGLYVLISALGPISGAHFNPAVTLAFAISERWRANKAAAYMAAQITGAALGVWAAHLMFNLELFQWSAKVRDGSNLLFSEFIATTGLLGTIFLLVRHNTAAIPAAVGAYITAAYWFTASTSFANPAVTFARTLTDTFSGIRTEDMPLFVGVQVAVAIGFGLFLRQHKRSQ